MSAPKHTPGPWEAHQQDRVLTGPHREEHASWFVTAEGPSEEEGTHICSVQADDTGKATASNAQLIAAAPDLLKALRDQVEEFDKRLAEYRASGDHHVALIAEQHHGQRMARARAAIAKAEGRS